MSKISDNSITIYEAIKNIKSEKYVMPAFQREFVWDLARIEKLWDSILLGYPIATFLFWHIDETNSSWDTYVYKFLNSIRFRSAGSPANGDYNFESVDTSITDTAILDGQQRLTSLLLSLDGQCYKLAPNERYTETAGLKTDLYIQLDKNKLVLEGEDEEADDEINPKQFDIKFINKVADVTRTHFKIRNIMEEKFQNPATRDAAIKEAVQYVPDSSNTYAENVLNILCRCIYEDKLIRYSEIYEMMQDDALEMFVRFNSAGKVLKKSEITMTILTSYWPESKNAFSRLLINNFKEFSTEFIIRTALMLYGNVLKSNITADVAKNLTQRWQDLVITLRKLDDLFKELNIDITRFKKSWNVLIPVIFAVYNNPDAFDKNKNEETYKESLDAIRVYITRAVLFRFFQSGTTGKLNKLKKIIIENDYCFTVDLINNFPDLAFTEAKLEDVLESEKGSRIAGEALYYLGKDWVNNNITYDQDHLHPETYFKRMPPASIDLSVWRKWCKDYNKLGNIEYLTPSENRGRGDSPLKEYFKQKTPEEQAQFIDHAMIPEGISLELTDFGKFYDARKNLLKEKLTALMN